MELKVIFFLIQTQICKIKNAKTKLIILSFQSNKQLLKDTNYQGNTAKSMGDLFSRNQNFEYKF